MQWLIAVAVVAGLYFWNRAANAAAAGVSPPALPAAPAPAAPAAPVVPAAPGVLPPTAGPTLRVTLVPGSMSVALPSGSILALVPPIGGAMPMNAVTEAPSQGALLNTLSQAAAGYTLSASPAFYGTPSVLSATVAWVDATSTPQTTALQIVAETSSVYITLQPGAMAPVVIPQADGEMTFIAPAGGTVVTGLVAPTSGPATLSGTPSQAAPTPSGTTSYYVSAAGPAAGTATISWTDSTGTAQVSTIAIAAV